MSNDYLSIVSAEDFAAVREPGAEPLVGDRTTNVFPAGALVVAFGDGGAGKTTLLLDCAFHLATARTWLPLEIGRRCRVGWVENEGPRGGFRDKVDAKIKAWDGPDLDGHLLIVEDPWGLFTFTNETHRRELATMVTENQLDVLILGPVQTLGIEGGGTPAEVREFAALIEQTRKLIDRPLCIILVHHTNKAGDVAGAWGPVPDTLLHVTPLGNGKTRVFWQKARWASAMHGTSWQLHWADGEGFELDTKPEITEDTIADGLLTAIRENPGGSWTQIRANDNVHGNATECARIRDRLLASGALVNSAARDGHFNLWPSDDPATPRSEPGTALERPHVPPVGDGEEPTRSAVPYVSRNGYGNGTAPEPTDDQNELQQLPGLA